LAARDHVDYYYVKWSAYATIGGSRIDITGFRLKYGLGAIPEAVFYPTVGTEPRSQKEAKAVEALLEARPYTAIEIYVKGETKMDSPQGAQTPGFPYNEYVKVFEGYYQGVGYQSQRSPAGGSVRLTGTAAHWLTGLTGTSSKTKLNAVKGPGGFAEVANIGAGPGLFDVKSLISAAPGSAASDLWVEFIKLLFYEITDNPNVWGESDNNSALAALDRMDDPSVFTGKADNSLVISTELAGGVPDEMLIRLYTDGIAYPLFKLWQQGSLWSALQIIAEEFGFTVVPLIDTATCAPVFGALGGEPFVTISANEYSDCFLDAATPALVTKLVLTGGLATSPYAAEPIINAVMGIASSEDAWVGPGAAVRGITITRDAPGWLKGEVTIGKLTRSSLGGDPGIIPDAVNPDANAEAPDYDYQKQFNNYLTSDLGDRVAQTMLFNLMLASRRGWVSGRFRLDVCPGSTVKMQVIDDKFSKFNDDPKYVYGLVNSVDIEMSAGGAGSTGHAATRFNLEYLRTAQEHEGFGGYLTSEEHPVYETKFVGAKLWSS
jgi:hypothetical protein